MSNCMTYPRPGNILSIPKRCWLHGDKWCGENCMAYRNGECAILELLNGIHDRLAELEPAISDLTEALKKVNGL